MLNFPRKKLRVLSLVSAMLEIEYATQQQIYGTQPPAEEGVNPGPKGRDLSKKEHETKKRKYPQNPYYNVPNENINKKMFLHLSSTA